MLDAESLWAIGVGGIVFGVLLIVAAVLIAVFLTDWRAIRELRAAKAAAPKEMP